MWACCLSFIARNSITVSRMNNSRATFLLTPAADGHIFRGPVPRPFYYRPPEEATDETSRVLRNRTALPLLRGLRGRPPRAADGRRGERVRFPLRQGQRGQAGRRRRLPALPREVHGR